MRIRSTDCGGVFWQGRTRLRIRSTDCCVADRSEPAAERLEPAAERLEPAKERLDTGELLRLDTGELLGPTAGETGSNTGFDCELGESTKEPDDWSERVVRRKESDENSRLR